MAENKETIILDFQVEQGDAISELEKTKIALIRLKDQQEELKKKYKESKVTLEEFASESVRMEGIQKKLSNQYNTVQKSVTGVKTQFDKLIETNKGIQKSLENSAAQLGEVASGLTSVIPGLGGFKKAQEGVNLALKANPIGAVVTLLIALKEIFSENTKFTKAFTQGIDALKGAFNFIINTIADTVTSFDNFKKAITSPIEFLKNLGKGAVDAAEKTAQANKFLNEEFELLEKDAQVVAKRALDQAEALRRLRDDETKTFSQRKKAAQDVLGFINVREQVLVNTQKQRLQALQDLLSLDKDNIELQLRVKEVQLEIADIQEDSQGKRTEALNGINTLLKEQKDIITSLKDIDAEVLANINQSVADFVNSVTNKDVLDAYNAIQERINSAIVTTSELAAIEAEAAKEREENEKDYQFQIQKSEQIEKQRIANTQIFSNSLGQLSGVLKENTALQKGLASTQALINTYLGATNVLTQKPPIPFPFNIIAAGATIASGLATVAKINGLSAAAGGGKFLTKGPQLLLVGDNPGGVERVTVEPISGRGKTVVGDGMIRLAGGGVVETQSATSGTRSSFAFANSMKNLPPIYTSITELRDKTNKVQFKENLVTA